jgi:hypothetical protein
VTSWVGNLVVHPHSTPFHAKDVTVVQSTRASTRDPIHSVRNRLARQAGLPCLDLFSATLVETACRGCGHRWRQRIYTPWITLSLFLSQVLSDDHSCDDAIDRLQKFRHDQGLAAVAPDTASYCDARQRLPEILCWDLVRRTGQVIHQQAKSSWLFHGRSVKIVDGTTVVMPDTPKNQKAFPQASTQAPGLGFPIARILVVFSLAVGTVLDAALGPYQGKQTSELALFRQILTEFQPGDLVLADRFFSSYLFRQRWHAELDLRTLKTEMQLEMLRTKSPEMVRKEIAVHFLAYNLIRGIMAEAARAEKLKPRSLSFQGALHTIRAFEESHLNDPVRIQGDLPRLIELIGKKRVGDRPDRYETRAVKRRPKPHPLLKMPRSEAKRLIKKGVIPYNKA